MTVGTKMHKVLASLESAKAEMATFSLETEDVTAKQMFHGFEKQLAPIIDGLKGRINYIESQEPQYKIENQIQSQMKSQKK